MWSQTHRGPVGSPDAGPWVPELVSACSVFSLAPRAPVPTPRAPDLSPLTRRSSPGGRSPETPTSRFRGVGVGARAASEAPEGIPFGPCNCLRKGVGCSLDSPGGALRSLPAPA